MGLDSLALQLELESVAVDRLVDLTVNSDGSKVSVFAFGNGLNC